MCCLHTCVEYVSGLREYKLCSFSLPLSLCVLNACKRMLSLRNTPHTHAHNNKPFIPEYVRGLILQMWFVTSGLEQSVTVFNLPRKLQYLSLKKHLVLYHAGASRLWVKKKKTTLFSCHIDVFFLHANLDFVTSISSCLKRGGVSFVRRCCIRELFHTYLSVRFLFELCCIY